MKTFNSFILDDEPKGLAATRYFLEKIPFIRIVATATNLEDAEKEILFHQPDILFLDIKIHEKTVFGLLETLEERNLNLGIVFITGFKNDYLLEAVNSCSMRYKWTYLHKPVVERKMVEALNKFRKQLGDEDDRYIFHQQGKIIQLFFRDIVYCETLGNGAKVILKNGKSFPVSDNLKTLESKFPKRIFHRLSSQHLINRNALTSAYRTTNQKYIAVLTTGEGTEKLDVPREQWTNLKNAFPATVENQAS
ncbi:MAG: response regulator transcription factor [Bacteroidetes bacterium]|nr:response regulator transcription factor [Bacteroidota bacterium]